MGKINYVAKLQSEIQVLEEEQSAKWQELKEQLLLTYESFKPAQIIQSTFKDLITSPHMLDNIIDTTLSIATGYISKKVVVGASSSIIRKVLGLFIQAGASKFISNHSGSIRSLGLIALKRIFRKKEKQLAKP